MPEFDRIRARRLYHEMVLMRRGMGLAHFGDLGGVNGFIVMLTIAQARDSLIGGISASAIADITQRGRRTVQRRLKDLVAAGYVSVEIERDNWKIWTATEAGVAIVDQVTDAAIDLMLETAKRIAEKPKK